MSSRGFAPREWLLVVSIALTIILGGKQAVSAQVQTDVVFLIDGSDSVERCLFDFETTAISRLLCGPQCSPCSAVNLPFDGSIAVSVVQFAGGIPGGAGVHVERQVLDSASAAGQVCQLIRAINPQSDWTPLEEGLRKAREVLEGSTTGAPDRLVVILSDQWLDEDPANKSRLAKILLEMCDNPPRVIAYRFSDVSAEDALCGIPLDDELIAWLSNPVNLGQNLFAPYKPIGDFTCRELCNHDDCGTLQSGCYYTRPELQPPTVQQFVDFVVANICALHNHTLTFTQQTQPSFTNPVTILDDVTFTITAQASEADVFYQWQRNGVDIANGGRIGGARTTELSIDDVQLCDGGVFQCRVWTPCVTVASQAATMVIDPNSAPDCSAHGIGDGVPDECQIIPSYLWTGTVANPDYRPDAGTGIAVDAAGNVAYCGAVNPVWPDQAVDYGLCGEAVFCLRKA